MFRVVSKRSRASIAAVHCRDKTDQKHTQLKPAERGAWVGVGFYDHQKFFGALINSYGARLRSEISLKVRKLDLKTLIAVLT